MRVRATNVCLAERSGPGACNALWSAFDPIPGMNEAIRIQSLFLENRSICLTKITGQLTFEFDRNP